MMYCETDSAFYAYWQWCEDQLVRWEYEQELAAEEYYNQTNTEDFSDDFCNF